MHTGCRRALRRALPAQAAALRRRTASRRATLDRKLIALDEAHEVRSWTQALKCTEEELRNAVLTVGHSAEKVRDCWTSHTSGRANKK